MTNSVFEKSFHRVMMGKTYWKGVALPSALYGAEVIDMKAEEIDKLQKAKRTAMRRILKAPKWTAHAAIRGEIGISNMKARIPRSRLLYLRRIETELGTKYFFVFILIHAQNVFKYSILNICSK